MYTRASDIYFACNMIYPQVYDSTREFMREGGEAKSKSDREMFSTIKSRARARQKARILHRWMCVYIVVHHAL